MRVEHTDTVFTDRVSRGPGARACRSPTATGRYTADDDDARSHSRARARSCSATSTPPGDADRWREPQRLDARHRRHRATPRGNVLGIMPHPERAVDPLLGSADGLRPVRIAARRASTPDRRSLMRTPRSTRRCRCSSAVAGTRRARKPPIDPGMTQRAGHRAGSASRPSERLERRRTRTCTTGTACEKKCGMSDVVVARERQGRRRGLPLEPSGSTPARAASPDAGHAPRTAIATAARAGGKRPDIKTPPIRARRPHPHRRRSLDSASPPGRSRHHAGARRRARAHARTSTTAW